MATAFNTIKTDLLRALGRTDSESVAIAERAINIACEVVGIAYRVPEFEANCAASITANVNYTDLSATANIAEIVTVYNSTDAWPMRFIPWDLFWSIVPANETSAKYYSQFGEKLYFKGVPTSGKTLIVYYTKHHANMAAGDSLPFDGYDAQVESIAMAFCWASLEEVESSELWMKIAGLLGISAERMYQVRSIVQGLPTSPEVMIGGSKSGGTGT